MSLETKRKILLENLVACENLLQNTYEEQKLHLREYWKEMFCYTEEQMKASTREDILSLYDAFVSLFSFTTPIQSIHKKISFAQQIASFFTPDELLTRVISGFVKRQVSFPTATIAFWPDDRDSGKVYEKFGHLFPSSKALHVKRFSEVADVLVSGEADFGIVPLENSSDGKHFGFYHMLERSDLMFCAVCNMDRTDHDVQTKYALISRSAVWFDDFTTTRMEISFYATDSTNLTAFLHMTEALHISLNRMDAIPLHHQKEGLKIYAVVSAKRSALPAFLCYLWLFEADYSVLGLFIQIEKD